MTICEYVRSIPRGVVKSLEAKTCGPVGLLHTQKVRIKYKKPERKSNFGAVRSVDDPKQTLPEDNIAYLSKNMNSGSS